MLSPIEKLPRVNDTIQIEITRACDLFTCSNCTRLLPFRKDDLHMSLDCVEDAILSVQDWPGVVALFGGNPCVHPEFPTVCEMLAHYIPDQRRRGLWSNHLRGHGAVVRETFYPHGRFNLNAHASPEAWAGFEEWCPGRGIRGSGENPSWHAPMLIAWQDLGLTEEEWVAARERCDINQRWSAAIVAREGRPFAYFCEVAGAIDGVRGENHGVPAVPGWWQRKMDGFPGQVKSCCDVGCGVPLRGQGHLDTAGVYDTTAAWEPFTRPATAVRKGLIELDVHTELGPTCAESTDYMSLRSRRDEHAECVRDRVPEA